MSFFTLTTQLISTFIQVCSMVGRPWIFSCPGVNYIMQMLFFLWFVCIFQTNANFWSWIFLFRFRRHIWYILWPIQLTSRKIVCLVLFLYTFTFKKSLMLLCLKMVIILPSSLILHYQAWIFKDFSLAAFDLWRSLLYQRRQECLEISKISPFSWQIKQYLTGMNTLLHFRWVKLSPRFLFNMDFFYATGQALTPHAQLVCEVLVLFPIIVCSISLILEVFLCG